eukprot:m.43562 g.43562  ORF g.43562 m.43562 type:complete len:166 (-) comp12233_c0_seq1:15-512(-)
MYTKVPRTSMGVVEDTVDVRGRIDQVFSVVANFALAECWDPSVKKSAGRVTGQPMGVGAKYDLMYVYRGKPTPMTFEIMRLDPPNFIEVVGEAETFRLSESIRFIQQPDHPDTMTRIKFKAHLALKGWRRPFIAFLSGTLDETGRAMSSGLENYFAIGDKMSRIR